MSYANGFGSRYKQKLNLKPLKTQNSLKTATANSSTLLTEMKKFISSGSNFDDLTARSCLSSELDYIFTIHEEKESEKEESLASFLNEEGIFQINLGYALKNLE